MNRMSRILQAFMFQQNSFFPHHLSTSVKMLYPTAATVAALAAYLGVGGRSPVAPTETLAANSTTDIKLATRYRHITSAPFYTKLTRSSTVALTQAKVPSTTSSPLLPHVAQSTLTQSSSPPSETTG